MCETYGVSRVTVRRAVLDLAQEGLLLREKGKGTFVTENYGMKTLGNVQGFTQELLGLNMRPSAQLIRCKIQMPDPVLRRNLELKEGERVITISRLRLANNEPCMVEVMNFPYSLVPGIEKENLDQSIYSLLRDRYQQEVVFAKDTLEPIIIGEYESRLLALSGATAGLRTCRFGYNAQHTVIEYSTHIIPGQKCKLVIDRTK